MRAFRTVILACPMEVVRIESYACEPSTCESPAPGGEQESSRTPAGERNEGVAAASGPVGFGAQETAAVQMLFFNLSAERIITMPDRRI